MTFSMSTSQYSHRINSLWPSDVIRRHKARFTLAQVMDCCLTAPSHYLNLCWITISEVLWHSPEGNFTGNAQDIYLWYEFEITYWRSQLHLPGANELNNLFVRCDSVKFSLDYFIEWKNFANISNKLRPLDWKWIHWPCLKLKGRRWSVINEIRFETTINEWRFCNR